MTRRRRLLATSALVIVVIAYVGRASRAASGPCSDPYSCTPGEICVSGVCTADTSPPAAAFAPIPQHTLVQQLNIDAIQAEDSFMPAGTNVVVRGPMLADGGFAPGSSWITDIYPDGGGGAVVPGVDGGVALTGSFGQYFIPGNPGEPTFVVLPDGGVLYVPDGGTLSVVGGGLFYRVDFSNFTEPGLILSDGGPFQADAGAANVVLGSRWGHYGGVVTIGPPDAGMPPGQYQVYIHTHDQVGNKLDTAPQMVVLDPDDFTVGLTPGAQSVTGGGTTSFTVDTSAVTAESLTLSVSGLPAGVTGSFTPSNVIASGQSATLTLSAVSTAVAVGPTSFLVTATAPSGATETSTATVAVMAASNDFSLSSPSSAVGLPAGRSAPVTIATAVKSGSAETIALTISTLPSGVTAAFAPASVTAGASSTLTLTGAASLGSGSSSFQVTGTAPSATHMLGFTLTTYTPPTVAVTSPTAGATVGGLVPITATAAVSSGSSVSQIAILVDASQVGTASASPATVNWDSSSVADGAHQINASVTDTTGGSASSATVAVTVSNPLQVSVTQPASGAKVSGDVAVTATASGFGIESVSLFVDGQPIGTGATSPLDVSWDSKSESNGTHQVTARATASGGRTAQSGAVQVDVENKHGCSSAGGVAAIFGLAALALFRPGRRRRVG